jgi:uncharacterized membrane protein
MRGLTIGLMSLAALAGCSPGGDQARGSSHGAAGEVAAAGPTSGAGLPPGYQARGQEPGWALAIGEDRRIDYADADGRKHVSVDLPAPIAQPDGMTYATPQLVLRVHYRRCNDVMSGQGFEHEVEVTIAGKTRHGCGGEHRPDWDL